MVLLESIFIVAIIVCVLALIFSIRAERKNYGFIMTTVLLIVCDVLCVLLIGSDKIRDSRNLLYVYYIAYSWLFFGTLWTIIRTTEMKKIRLSLIPMAAICSFMTVLVFYCFSVPHVITFSKKVYFGRIWWVIESVTDSGHILNFDMFCAMNVLACMLIIAMSLQCMIRSHKMFGSKYLMLIFLQVLMMVFVILNRVFSLPVWICTLVMNPVCYLLYYYAFIQSDLKLRDDVIMTFANEMSDGLILYNANNNLIHVNDLIKNLIDPDFLSKLSDIRVLEDWISHVEYVEKIKTLHYKKGDEDIYFIVRKHIVGTEDNEVGKAFIFHDTTNSINQIRLMEKVNDELERTSRMKSDFLANMSHELRTPMNAVIGMTEIALREDISPKLKDCLNQISTSGRNLLNIINDILDYSKIDAGKMEIIPDEYEPLSEVNDIANILQTRIGDKDLELYFIVDPALPHKLLGDCMRIRQVLINIANNAIKFTQKGIIRITLECEKKSDEELNLIYHVKDTGQGIKEEDLNKLFVSFQQVDSKRNRNVEGTGLGLAISKSLCEAMGGTIGVESEYGKGSDFWFSIPQRIVNPTPDLVVENADGKYAYCLNEKMLMTDEFTREMSVLGLDSKVIASLSDYRPTGKKEYLFIERAYYTQETEAFLDEHPDVTGVVLTDFGSDLKADRKNMYVMMRPQTTLSMVLALNGKQYTDLDLDPDDDRFTHFIAPTARVLIVDDNSINLTIATGLLEPLKIMCDTALSGAEAMDKIREMPYDIIFMDHMMPEMDGIDTTKAIREQIPSASETPIIALTANVVEGTRDMFLEAGMADMIPKPIDVKQLNFKVYSWLPEYKIQHMDEKDIRQNEEESYKASGRYECLDCEKAISGLGSAALFDKIVEEYYKRGRRTRSEIEDALATGDIHDYALKTHALKSSSRQIGAMDLGDVAEKLEHAAKAEDMATIDQYHSSAMEILDKLITDLSEYFPEDEGRDDLPPISDEEITEVFDRLRTACDNLEMDEMEACAEILKVHSYPDDKKELIEKMLNAIDMIDTESCVEMIDAYFA